MKRHVATILTAMAAVAMMFALPAAANAYEVAQGFERLDSKIRTARDNGSLTRWEAREVRAMQVRAEDTIDAALRDRYITRAEARRILRQTRSAMNLFRDYRDNRIVSRPVVRYDSRVVVHTCSRCSHRR